MKRTAETRSPGFLLLSILDYPNLNAKRKGLSRLIDMIITGDAEAVYITHKDRLTRFRYEYLERF